MWNGSVETLSFSGNGSAETLSFSGNGSAETLSFSGNGSAETLSFSGLIKTVSFIPIKTKEKFSLMTGRTC
jgi:hypothetical protein